MTIVYFIIALGILVFIHEFGHFIMAKRQGIGVEKFSLGFGPKLFSMRRGETEYLISALPLGGYVKLRGEDPAEADQNDPASFSARPLWHRLKVVLAGPGMNLALAFVFLPLVFLVGRVEPAYFQEPPVVMGVEKGSAAVRSDLQEGDRVLKIDDEATPTWKDLLDFVILHGGQKVVVTVDRRGGLLTRELMIVSEGDGSGPGVLGIEPHFFLGNDAVVDEVMGGSPAAEEGVQAGDRIVEINGTPVSGWTKMVDRINQGGGKTLSIEILRGGQKMDLSLTPRHDEATGRWMLGIKKDYEKSGPKMVVRKYPLGKAIVEGTKEGLKLSSMTYSVLGRLVTGRISYKALGGPIRIAQASAQAAKAGFSHFLYFLAFLSVQLGLLNLLPIPVLDGGHVLFYAIEGVTRRPLSMRVRGIMEQCGFVLLLGLMVLITFNDVNSVWGIRSILERIRGLF